MGFSSVFSVLLSFFPNSQKQRHTKVKRISLEKMKKMVKMGSLKGERKSWEKKKISISHPWRIIGSICNSDFIPGIGNIF